MARVFHPVDAALPAQVTRDERWEGSDRVLICSWSRSLDKAGETPSLREQALRDELMPLAWKGGADKAIKVGKRVGSLHYLAMWQGLRGETLDVDTDCTATLTCPRFQTLVTFTGHLQALAIAPSEEN